MNEKIKRLKQKINSIEKDIEDRRKGFEHNIKPLKQILEDSKDSLKIAIVNEKTDKLREYLLENRNDKRLNNWITLIDQLMLPDEEKKKIPYLL